MDHCTSHLISEMEMRVHHSSSIPKGLVRNCFLLSPVLQSHGRFEATPTVTPRPAVPCGIVPSWPARIDALYIVGTLANRGILVLDAHK